MRPTRNARSSGISRIWRPAGEQDLVAAGAPLDVVPEIIHLHFILRECGIVLLNQNFAKVKRLPTHLDARCGRERADTHDRQIGVDATVEEIEIENVRHGSTPRQAIDDWLLRARSLIVAQCRDRMISDKIWQV
jgi:hypothetical protein